MESISGDTLKLSNFWKKGIIENFIGENVLILENEKDQLLKTLEDSEPEGPFNSCGA